MQSKTLHAVSLTLYGCATAGGTVTATLSRDGSTVDTTTQTVTVVPPGISIEISDLVSSLTEGETDSFSVTAENLDSSESYKIVLTSSNGAVGFHGYCWLDDYERSVPANRTSYTIFHSLKACATPGDTLKATLLSDGSEIVSATQYVTVEPDLSPKIAMHGFWDGIYAIGAGYSDFTVTARQLDSSASYKIKLTMDDDEPGDKIGISFDRGCSVQVKEVTVQEGATSYTGDFHLQPCDGTTGSVTAKLFEDDREVHVHDATHPVKVSADVRLRIYGLNDGTHQINNGANVAFGVRVDGLDSTRSYTVVVETSVAGIGFNSGCLDRSKRVLLTGKTSYTSANTSDLPNTLYGCAVGRGSVTAKLYRGDFVTPGTPDLPANRHRGDSRSVNVRN